MPYPRNHLELARVRPLLTGDVGTLGATYPAHVADAPQETQAAKPLDISQPRVVVGAKAPAGDARKAVGEE